VLAWHAVGWSGEAAAAADVEGAASSSTSTEDRRPTELPFQLQVTYTDLDGTRAMRVLTRAQPVTRDRTEAETRTSDTLSYSLYCKLAL